MIESRTLLEIAKFLSPAEALQCKSVSTQFLTVCSSDELWFSYLGRKGTEYRLSLKSVLSPQSAYRLYVKSSVILRDHRLYHYNVPTKQWKETTLPREWDIGSVGICVKVGTERLFCVDFGTHKQTTFIIDCDRVTIKILPPLSDDTRYPGICRFGDFIYSFSGNILLQIRQCLRLNLATLHWESLPDCLNPRQSFNPVVYQGCMFLPCGCQYSVEQYDPLQARFSLLIADTSLQHSTAAVIESEELVIISPTAIYRWSLRSQQGTLQQLQRPMPTAWSTCTPILYEQEVVLTWGYRDECSVSALRLLTRQWVSSRPPSSPSPPVIA